MTEIGITKDIPKILLKFYQNWAGIARAAGASLPVDGMPPKSELFR